jgi:hypothetical protein
MAYKHIWFAVLIVVCGCLNTQIKEKFVCSDGWVADTPAGCEGHTLSCPNCTCKKTICPECTAEVKHMCVNATTPAASGPDISCASLGCPTGTRYVSSKSSAKYHACDCRFAKVLSKKNIICYKNEQEAQAAGKLPCGICAKN